MSDQSDPNKAENTPKDKLEEGLAPPGTGASEAEASENKEDDEELDSSTILKLGVVCVILWIIAGAVFFSKMGQAKIDYHLGNMAESLAKSGKLNDEDVNALVELGPEAVPNLVKELNSSTETGRIGIGVLVVLGKMKNEAAKKALKDALAHPNHQVRNNACVQLIKDSDDAGVATMVKDLWAKADSASRVQMAKFIFYKVKQKIAEPYALEGLVDGTLQVRGFCIEFFRQKYPDLNIPKDGHTAPQKKLLVYAPLVKAWIDAGAKKESAPKYPEFERKQVEATPNKLVKPKDTK